MPKSNHGANRGSARSVSYLRKFSKGGLGFTLTAAVALFVSASAVCSAAEILRWSPDKPIVQDYLSDDNGFEVLPRLGTDGNGTYMAAYSSDPNICVAISTDSGATWTEPQVIATAAYDDGYGLSYDAITQSVVYTGDAWLVYWRGVYRSFDLTTERNFVSRSEDGKYWSDAKLLKPPFTYGGYSGNWDFLNGGDMESDGAGNVVAILDYNTVYRSADSGVTWTTSTLEQATEGHLYKQRLEVDYAGGNKWYIATSGQYRDQRTGNFLDRFSTLFTSVDNGVSWSARDTTSDVAVVNEMKARGDMIVSINLPTINVSTDGGVTWSGGTAEGEDADQALAVDENGNWIAGKTDQLFSSTNPANGWTTKPSIAVPDGDVLAPNIVSGAPGEFVMMRSFKPLQQAWPGPDADIISQTTTDTGTNWTAPLNVSGPDDTAQIKHQGARVAAGDNGDILAAWFTQPDNIMVAKSTDYGKTWNDPQRLNPPQSYSGVTDLALAYAGQGRWLVAWTPGTTAYEWWDYMWSDDNGETWSPLTTLFGDVVAGSGEGTLVKGQPMKTIPPTYGLARLPREAIYWEEPQIIDHKPIAIQQTTAENWFVIAEGGIVYQSNDDGRTWYLAPPTQNVPLATAKVTVDSAGTAMAIYYQDLISGDYENLVASPSFDNGATWSAPVPLNSQHSYWPGFGLSYWGDIVSPDWQTFVVTWSDSREGVHTAVSTDNGQTWKKSAQFPALEGYYDFRKRPNLTGADGNLVITFDTGAEVLYSTAQVGPAAATDWQLFE